MENRLACFGRFLAVALAMGAAAALADPVTYYVDPTNGVDDVAHDGTSWEKAKNSLAEALALASSGDTVKAAVGVYETGYAEPTVEKHVARFRARIPAGVTLVATGAVTRTIIKGASATVDQGSGCGTDAVAGVYLAGAGAEIRGFTIRDGRGWRDGSAYLYGGGVYADGGKIVDCRILSNAAGRCGAGVGGTYVRCYFSGNWGTMLNSGIYNASLYNCVIGTSSSYFAWTTHSYNCTYLSSCTTAIRDVNGSAYNVNNCLILSPNINDQGGYFRNCVFGPNSKFTSNEGWKTNSFCRKATTAAEAAIDSTTFMPDGGSLAVDAADASLLPQAYRDIDYAGTNRTIGVAMDVGACENDYVRTVVAEEIEGITYEGLETGTNKKPVPFSFTVRKGTTKRPMTGICTNGVLVAFGSDNAVTIEVPAIGGTITVNAQGEAATWYVDDALGTDDDPIGYLPGADAFKTLAAALANPNLLSGDTVSVAPGTYDDGQGSLTDAGDGSSTSMTGYYRAVVPAGVSLVASGSRGETVIKGASATGGGCGADSIACVSLGANALVRGFTLRGGYATKVANGDYFYGGGVRAASGGKIVDCNVESCVAVRGGAGGYGTWIRCYFTGCSAGLGAGFYSGAALYNCVINCAISDYFACNATCHHCTFFESVSYPMRGLSTYCRMYNCLIRSSKLFQQSNGSGIATRCAILASVPLPGSCQTNDCRLAASLAELAVDSMYIPVRDTLAIDAADETSTTFPAGYGDTDFNGGPRKVGASRDIGACEYDPSVGYVDISDSSTGLVITGASLGKTLVRPPATLTVKIGRSYDVLPIASGFTVNGTFVSFEGKADDYEYSYTVTGAADSLAIAAVYPTYNTWYVNRNAADDADETGDGKTPTRAVRTLAKVMTFAKSGDLVIALPGVYDEGDAGTVGSSQTSNRAILPSGVTFKSRDGAAVTEIRGAVSPTPTSYGCGPGAMRCLTASGSSTISGFTFSGARTASTGSEPGGVSNGSGVTYLDCLFTNNVTIYRGGAGNMGTYRRCRFFYNRCCGGQGTSLIGGLTLSDCIFDRDSGDCHAVYAENASTIRNCTFGSHLHSSVREPRSAPDVATYLDNCIVLCNQAQGCGYRNCVMVGKTSGSSSYAASCIVTNASAILLDAAYRPVRGSCVAIDAANPSYRPSGAGTLDVYGGQRVYNGVLDVGACEYDWRGDFASALARRRVTVPAADPDVTLTNGVVTVAAGATLTVRLTTGACAGTATLTTGGDGTPTVACATAEVTTFGSVHSFEAAANASYDVTVTAANDAVTVVSVRPPRQGAAFILR